MAGKGPADLWWRERRRRIMKGTAAEKATERLARDLAARLGQKEGLTWVSIEGGEEGTRLVQAVLEYLGGLGRFNRVIVARLASVDEDSSIPLPSGVELVDPAALREMGVQADLVTLSFALTAAEDAIGAVEVALKCVKGGGLVGTCDYDIPDKEGGIVGRAKWRAWMEMYGREAKPEAKKHLERRISKEAEYAGKGHPGSRLSRLLLGRAPFATMVLSARECQGSRARIERGMRRPSLFPPTFLYSLSWEDPRRDEEVLQPGSSDVCLTLASGGCNAFDLTLQGAKEVHAVDLNPAQTSLLELKREAVRRLPYEDVWRMFGEGFHPNIEWLYEWHLAPFLSQTAQDFWQPRLRYFKDNFYHHGSMGKGILALRFVLRVLGLAKKSEEFVNAPTLEDQVNVWESIWLVKALKHTPRWVTRPIARLVVNRFVLWWVAGVPSNQAKLIHQDGRDLAEYLATCFDGLARGSHVNTSNYFYRAVLTGKFAKGCCPRFLREDDFRRLKEEGLLDRITIVTGHFDAELAKRHHTRVILMDHADWLSKGECTALARSLARSVPPGGRVIWRSASKRPPYVDDIAAAGFDASRCDCHHEAGKSCLDRVNMYASFWVAIRRESKP